MRQIIAERIQAQTPLVDVAARRVWDEYRAAMGLRGREVRDVPSASELSAAAFVAESSAFAVEEENRRPNRRGAPWSIELAEAHFIARWVDTDDNHVSSVEWPLPLIRSALSRYSLRKQPPAKTARQLLADRAARAAEPKEPSPAPIPMPANALENLRRAGLVAP